MVRAAPSADHGDLRRDRGAGDLRVRAVNEMANFFIFIFKFFFASDNCCTNI